MVTRDRSEDRQRLNDSGVLIDCPPSPVLPRSPTSVPSGHGHAGSIWRAQRILNLEGEALASLSALYILRELFVLVSSIERMQGASSSSDSPLFRYVKTSSGGKSALPFRPCHYFDFICGTSFGGIAAIMLGVMRLTIDETIERCERILVAICPSISKVSLSFATWDRKSKNSGTLKQKLASELENREYVVGKDNVEGTDANLSSKWAFATMNANEQMCKTIVFTTQEARKGGVRRPFVFRSYHQTNQSARARNPDRDTTDVYLVDACRASLSTPSMFDSVRIPELGKFRAASVSRMNPAIEAYNEVHENYNAEVKCLLSVGIDSARPLGTDSSSPSARLEKFDEQLLSEATSQEFQARRFADIDLLREVPSTNLADAMELTRQRAVRYCKGDASTKKHLHSWADRLVRYRRLRAETVRWNEYVGFEVRYPEKGSGADFYPRSASFS